MKFTQIKQYLVSTILALSIILSFGVCASANAMVAMPMDSMTYENTSISNYTNQHHVISSVEEKITTNQIENQDNEPTPNPLPYFVQFQKNNVNQQKDTPKDITISSSYNPPDIIRLTSNIRF